MDNQSNSGTADAEGVRLRASEKWRPDWSVLIDALIIVTVLVAVKQTFLLITIKYAGPISTFTAMAVATWRLRAQGMGWGDLGFRRPESWRKTLLWSGAAFALIAISGGAGSAFAELFYDKAYVADRFGDIEGDVPMYLVWMALVWTHGAFFEEMLFRAFLINRLGVFLGGGTWATVLSVVIAAVFFGYRHAYYQGPNGFIVTGIIGLALGFFYVWIGRNNLMPQILAHGYANSIGFTMRFLGLKE